MKRYLLLSLFLTIALTACGPETEPDQDTVPKSTKEQGDPRQDAPS
jgi:hypothetical protein